MFIQDKKLYYIANVRIPTEKAHGVHMMKMCEALALQTEVIFVAPRRLNKIKSDPFEYFNVHNNFKIQKLPSLDLIPYVPFLGYWLQTFTYIVSLFFKFIFAPRKNVLIHTREFLIATMFYKMGYKISYEAHRVPQKKKSFFTVLKGIEPIITNSKGVAEEFRKKGFKNVYALPNAVDVKEFDISKSKYVLRQEFSLPQDNKIILYTGHLYGWKGIETVLQTVKNFKSQNSKIKFIFVGGTEGDVKKYQEKTKDLDNIMFLGHKPKKDIPKYLKAADILILPNSPISEESAKYTSPMKLFEYMAAGRPIIASDMPSIREILNENNSMLVEPDNSEEFTAAIQKVLNDDSFAEKISIQAQNDVKEHTWFKRAEKLLNIISAN